MAGNKPRSGIGRWREHERQQKRADKDQRRLARANARKERRNGG